MTAKRIVALIVALCMMLICIPAMAAENDGYQFGDLGEKTAEQLVNPGQYEITVSVPGAVKSDKYSEIIVMVDASSSQGSNLTKLKAMLVNMAEELLHNDGSVRLTLMGFGMGPSNVGSFYNAQTLEKYLANVTQGDLRQGVSATNCEASLEFVLDYVENSDKLHETVVIYTSDGNANMDETPFNLSQWKENPSWWYKSATLPAFTDYLAGEQCQILMVDGYVFGSTASFYPEQSVAVEMAELQYGLESEEYAAAVDALYNAIVGDSEENKLAYIDETWAEIFAASGLNYYEPNKVSEMEAAFLDYYDGRSAYNSFLCAIHGRLAAEYPDHHGNKTTTWGARAADSADKLADHEKVLELYMVDFSTNNPTWMNPDSSYENRVTSEDITYMTSASFSAALDDIEDLTGEIFTTVYDNATVVDPMSKWVDLDPSSIRIYQDDLLIYEYGTGWLYEDRQPAENPITLTQDDDGKDVITWRIKDGHLLYTDRYFLKYVVDVDETVEGFEYGKDYPANDPTYVEYTDIHGDTVKANVDVPEVEELMEPDTFGEEELGFKLYKGSKKNNSPIAGIVFDIYKVTGTANLTPTAEEIALYKTPENHIASITTNAYGYAAYNLTENGYGEGRYLLVEQPSDKVAAPVEPFYVYLPYYNTETQESLNVISIYPKNELIPEEQPPIQPDIPTDDKPEKGKIVVLKHADGHEEVVLAGAEFQVYRPAAEGESAVMEVSYNGAKIGIVPVMEGEEPVMIVTGDDGVGISAELDFGLYFLVETQAPQGYNVLEEPIVAFVSATSGLSANAVKIANIPGVQLPETGGPGTWMFTLTGLACCGLAAVILLGKRRAFSK